MKDPIPRGVQQRAGTGNSNNHSGHKNGKSKPNKNDYCWKYNKGVKCKFGSRCKFIERCSYCDSGAHGLYNCPKKNKNKNSNNSANGNNGSKDDSPTVGGGN